jgi:hypothetical protein
MSEGFGFDIFDHAGNDIALATDSASYNGFARTNAASAISAAALVDTRSL